jgi:hypothetical protein
VPWKEDSLENVLVKVVKKGVEMSNLAEDDPGYGFHELML